MLHLEILEDFERDRSREDELREKFNSMSLEELKFEAFELEEKRKELNLQISTLINIVDKKKKYEEQQIIKKAINKALQA